MPARVLFIGLDAAEATLLERWADEGLLPAFARLRQEGVQARLGNSLETLPGAIWPELVSGRSCGRTALYFHPRQLHTGEAGLRRVEPEEVDTSQYWWVTAGEAGRRVAALQQVQTVPHPGLNGIQLFECPPPQRTDPNRREGGTPSGAWYLEVASRGGAVR